MGEIRRLGFDELEPELQDALRAKVERLGYLGEFFAVGGHQPAATAAFQHFTESLKEALPPELTEVVALSIASALGNAYERVQHERLAASLGFPLEWIAAAVGRGQTAALSKEARAARRLALAVLEGYGHGAAEDLAHAVDAVGEEHAVGLLLTLGRYVAHAVIANTLDLAAPVQGVLADAPATDHSR
jgi:alkylhydroperoxidase family enzyme